MKGPEKSIFTVILMLLLVSCSSSDSDSNEGESSGWLIPFDEVQDGGPGKDGIPSIDTPVFVDSSTEEWHAMPARVLVVGIIDNGVAKAYPHHILNWHEVVNDNTEGSHITLSYCPLTGSAISWQNSAVTGANKTFGVSGLLYNSNLILYDRATDSNWSQMQIRAVSGSQSGTDLTERLIQNVETTWEQWQAWYPDSLLLSAEQGFSRNYNNYPYGDYLRSSRLLFEVDNSDDTRMHPKQRALGIITESEVKVYQISEFMDDIDVINDTVGGEAMVVIGSRMQGFGIAFSSQLSDGSTLEFTAVQDGTLFHLEDQNGEHWNLHGEGVSDGVQGQQLTMAKHYIAFWFSWAAFFGDVNIHQFN